MTRNPRIPLLFLAAFILGVCATAACAQSARLGEAVGPDGVTQRLQLTPVRRSAIYNAAVQQRVHGSNGEFVANIGAPVPPSIALRDLPEQAALGAPGGGLLKYAMVADDVMVVDPIRIRVVDVIHHGAEP